ncbi:hypothetical protein RJG79_00090 [Mycoplasmatota bacterium WC44]
MKKFRIIFPLLAVTFILTACIPGTDAYTDKQAGFLWGIWHGWIAPISLIISIFKSNVGIYEINNTGFWYDFGFYAAIVGGFGGFSFSRRNKKKKKGD